MYTSAILMKECSNIYIDKVQLNDNRFGNTLTLVNPYGHVNIQEYKFFNNINEHKSSTNAGSSFAGGHSIFKIRVYYAHH